MRSRTAWNALRSVGFGLPHQWQRDWRDADFCVVDIETTGLNPDVDEIISVGMVPVSGGRIQVAQTVYLEFRPSGEIGRESVKVHSLRSADLVDALPIGEQVQAIVAAVAGRCVVAHTAWIEAEFLGRVLNNYGYRLPLPLVDTAVLAEKCQIFSRSVSGRMISLEYAADLMRLPVHTPHHALGDAMTTAHVFIALASRLSAVQRLTVAELAILSRSR